jgi:hypothetical protein
MPDRHRVVMLEKTCDAMPSQWEGQTADGGWVYVRYRHGWLSIGFGSTLDDAVGDDTIGIPLDYGGGGELTYDELRAATQDQVAWP